MLDVSRIRAITLDLDDTLWPVWPTIRQAENELHAWLQTHAPRTAVLAGDRQTAGAARQQVLAARPGIGHDLGRQRLEAIRILLLQAGDDPGLAELAYDVFFEARQRVTLFDDALPALEFMAARFPLVALSNGNADVERVGIGQFFAAAVAAHSAGVSKPDPRIFHLGAEASGVPAEQVLHIGDDPGMDAIGAMDAGMQAIWVNRAQAPWPDEMARQPHAEVHNLTALCQLLA